MLLAWVFGRIDPEKVGSTGAAFEAVAKVCKFVEKGYRGLSPKLGEKTDDEVPLSASFQEIRLRCGIGRDIDNLILVREPAELVVELATAAGLLGDSTSNEKKGKK